MALTQDQINNARSRLDNKKYETTMKFGLMGKPPKKVKPSDDQPGMLSSIADWAVNYFSKDEVKPEPQASVSIWDNMPPIVNLITENFMSRPISQNNTYNKAVPSALGAIPSGQDLTPQLMSDPAKPNYAPEYGDLVGRFDGQLGYVNTDTSAAVADAIIAAPVAASDAAPVAAERSGLMARRDEAATALYKERRQGLLPEADDKVRVGVNKNKLISDTLDVLLTVESPRDHTDPAGNFTYAYGILPRTARSLGFDRNATKANGDLVYPYTDKGRKDFAWNVYRAYLDNQEEIDPELWSSIDDKFKVGALSYTVNTGSFQDSPLLRRALIDGNEEEIPTQLKDGINANYEVLSRGADGKLLKDDEGNNIPVKDANGEVVRQDFADKGLSKRRAIEYNLLMQGTDNFVRVDNVAVTGTRQAPVFEWRSADGDVLHSFASDNELAPLSTFTATSTALPSR